MENRLCLNKRPVYELPDDVLIGQYVRRKKNPSIPDFEPDICLTLFGASTGKNRKKYEVARQIWIKTGNVELIDFVLSYDFKNKLGAVNNLYFIDISNFKKIILEEFYGGE